MSDAATALSGLLAVLAGAGAVYQLIAAGLVRRAFRPRALSPAPFYPPVTLIKPLHGASPGLFEALSGFCAQDYPGKIQILFGVHNKADPATAVVAQLQMMFSEVDIELVVDERRHGANHKASNLINMRERAKHGVLVLSDADIVVGSDYLRRVVDALSAPEVGVVTCLYLGRANCGLWSQMAAMGIDYQFLPSAVLGKAIGLAEPCFGSTIALTQEALTRIGGFDAFADHLADDYEMGRAARAKGYQIAIPPMTVIHDCDEASWGELIGHELRWARTVRMIDPVGYAGSLVTHAIPMALLAAITAGFPLWSLGLVFVSLGSRLALKASVDAATGGRAGPWFLVPIRDIFAFSVFLASFAVNQVAWRGQRFRVGKDGVLVDK